MLPDCCRASHFLSSVCEKQSLGFSVVLGLRFGALEHVCVCVCVCMCVLKVRVSAACNARWRARESLSPLKFRFVLLVLCCVLPDSRASESRPK